MARIIATLEFEADTTNDVQAEIEYCVEELRADVAVQVSQAGANYVQASIEGSEADVMSTVGLLNSSTHASYCDLEIESVSCKAA
jgi:hypothetical protein